MSMWRMRSSIAPRPVWSMRCSINWRGACVPANSSGPSRAVARRADPSSAEDRLIARYFRPLARHPGALGLRDDAAQITPPAGCDLVITADAVVGGVHFFPDDPPDTIARKALRVN